VLLVKEISSRKRKLGELQVAHELTTDSKQHGWNVKQQAILKKKM